MTTVKEMFDGYAKATEKIWAHDRSETEGSSGIFQCARKRWFAQNDTPHDAGYVDRYGAKKRGDLLENHWFVPGLRHGLPPSVTLLWSGDEQQTFVDGYISATPDGLIVNRSNADFTIEGVTLAPGECVGVECKSIDPRVDLKEAKAEHIGQVHVQMGLIRSCTEYQPDKVIVTYIEASFIDEISTFVVKFDEAIYAAAKARAKITMMATDPLTISPEGKIAGGRECEYCPYASHCAAVSVAGIPKDEAKLDEATLALGAHLAHSYEDAKLAAKAADERKERAAESVKEFLRVNRTRKAGDEGWSATYFPVKGRRSLDQDAAKAAGIDLEPFMKDGDPSERLAVKIK